MYSHRKLRFLPSAVLILPVLLGNISSAEPFNIAPDGLAIMGLSDSLDGTGDVYNANANSGQIVEVNNDIFYYPEEFAFNIGTDDGVDDYRTQVPDEPDFVNDYVGILWDTPQSNINSLQFQHYIALDGGWFGPGENGAGVALEAADLAAPAVQVTTNGSTWTTITTNADDYVSSHTGVARGTGFATATIGPMTTFSFPTQNSILGIRVIGDAGGTADGNGFTAYTEFRVFQDSGQVFPTLDITTATGEMTIKTGSGTPLEIAGYSITSDSAAGALDESSWTTVDDNYDAGNAGPSQIDTVNDWTELPGTESTTLLSEQILTGSGSGASLGANLELSLGNIWFQNPLQGDIFAEVILADGRRRRMDVTYDGMADNPLQAGDLNADGVINELDWPIVRDAFNSDFSLLSPAERYGLGDVNTDGVVDEFDFADFKLLYDAAAGLGAFDSMVAGLGVPEPSSIPTLVCGLLMGAVAFRRNYRTNPAMQ